MRIVRMGNSFELTQDEMQKAYLEVRHVNDLVDTRSWIIDHKSRITLSDTDIAKVAEEARRLYEKCECMDYSFYSFVEDAYTELIGDGTIEEIP